MPKLGKYDELAHSPATLEDIEAARLKAESLVMTSKGPLQFDSASRQRLVDVLRVLSSDAEPHEQRYQVSWKMADNSVWAYTFVELRDLIFEAESLVGPRVLSAFQKAQSLKERYKTEGYGVVTLRDISPENW